MLKIKEDIPRERCTGELLKKLRQSGFRTNGVAYSLEKIITDCGFNLPGNTTDEYGHTYYGFRHCEFVKMYLNYADACAQEILFLYELKLIKL